MSCTYRVRHTQDNKHKQQVNTGGWGRDRPPASGEGSVHDEAMERERERERGLECLLKTAGPHTELKQEIPAGGGRGGVGAAKES